MPNNHVAQRSCSTLCSPLGTTGCSCRLNQASTNLSVFFLFFSLSQFMLDSFSSVAVHLCQGSPCSSAADLFPSNPERALQGCVSLSRSVHPLLHVKHNPSVFILWHLSGRLRVYRGRRAKPKMLSPPWWLLTWRPRFICYEKLVFYLLTSQWSFLFLHFASIMGNIHCGGAELHDPYNHKKCFLISITSHAQLFF